MEKFLVIKDIVKRVQRFNLRGRTVEFKLKAVPEGTEPVGWVKDAVAQVVQRATEGLRPQDQVGFSFCSKDFKRGEGWIRFREACKVTLDDIWDTIASVYQSNSAGLNTETFCLGVTSVRMPTGKGPARKYNSFAEECAMRKGIMTITNKDNLCLPRAIVVAIARVTKDADYTKVRLDIGKMQTLRAMQLMADAEVNIPADGAGIPELTLFQQHLKDDYKITVYKYGSKGRDIIFSGSEASINLNLLFHDGHYNVITSLTAAFCCNYYCEECHIPYDHKSRHRCGGTCQACQQTPSCDRNKLKVKCEDCRRLFRGQECYENHKKKGSMEKNKSVCESLSRCDECLKMVKSDRRHTCGEMFCKICNTHTSADHQCYMQRDKGKPKTKDLLFVFYDLETQQETMLENGSLQHKPNLCVFNQRCDDCMNVDQQIVCKKCGVRQQIIKCSDPIPSFLHYVLTMRKKFKNIVVLAHNGQAFDHQFILNYIITQTDLTPEIIKRGSKIILLQLDNVKFLDSLNYFPLGLAKLPKAFGLPDTFKKGYFPHLFNTTVNENYVGSLPPIEYYSPDSMKEEDRTTFLKWYNEHKNDMFDMQRDLVAYCVSDVEILTQACLKFREQLLSTTNVCPFTEACTVASACNKVFRRNFLKPDTIGIIPRNGYRCRDNQSKIATQWLVWEEAQRNINILHAAKQKETTIKGVKVDGYCKETNQIFEFHGCYYHGCPSCLKYNRKEPLHDSPSETLDCRYEATVAKTERLREHGYEIVEMWECDFRRRMQINKEIENCTKNHPLLIHTPLNPRDAFYGGRTGNTRTYYKATKGEKIMYADVCSLYPWVCKYGKFPIGHPQVLIGSECQSVDVKKTDGIIKCKILPPNNLYHPVLPTKMHNKLMFLLCVSCGEERHADCMHSEDERALRGTWVIDEVVKAMEKGYKIMEIYEIWKYNVKQYDPSTKADGLFVEMMDKFIKIKQQASGWPGHCTTQQQKEEYIQDFFNQEGIKLETAEILKNPGLRCQAKLMLNSFWGKLGQSERQPKTKIVNTPEEFFSMLANPAIDVNHILPINDKTLLVNYEFKEEAYDPLSTVNVCLAAYTTAQARLKLYSYLEELEDRVLYYDTDSVIYISRDGESDVSLGSCIGDMTDELMEYGSNSYISEFVSGGPKNYVFKLFSTNDNEEKIVCKVKGICLNYSASQKVNFTSIKDMILNDNSEPISIISKNIRRTEKHEVITIEETKIYKPNSTKRLFLENHDSVPYGYKRIRLTE